MKSLFNTVLFKEQLKRYWAVGVLSFIIYFLGCLLPLWSAGNINSACNTMLSILEMSHPLIILSNLIVPLSAVISIFSYMYRQNSAGVIHSMPFTKNELFVTNVFTGLLLVTLPLFIFCVLLSVMPVEFSFEYERWVSVNVFPNGLTKGDIINTLPVVAAFFTRTLLSFVFYYMVFLTAAMVVGNQIIYFLVSFMFPFLPVGLFMLFALVAYYYVFGYSIDTTPLEQLFVYTNPVALPAVFTRASSNIGWPPVIQSLVSHYAVYILIAAALLCLSIWLYRIRRLERAGDTVVFEPLKNVLIFLLSVTGMVSLGIFLLALSGFISMLYIGFFVGFVLAFFIAQMIAEKSFNVFYKFKALLIHGAVVLGIMAVIVVASRADITGYVKHVPDVSEIEGVYYGWYGQIKNYESETGTYDRMFITDQQTINETVALHEKIIANRGEQRKYFLNGLASNYRTSSIPTVKQNINYLLKNGKILSRQYVLSEEFYKSSGLEALMLSENVINSEVHWLNTPEDIDFIEIETYIYNGRDTFYDNFIQIKIIDREEIASLAVELKKDYLYYRRNELWTADVPNGKIRFNAYCYGKPGSGIRQHNYVNADYAENTVAWLTAHGYEFE